MTRCSVELTPCGDWECRDGEDPKSPAEGARRFEPRSVSAIQRDRSEAIERPEPRAHEAGVSSGGSRSRRTSTQLSAGREVPRQLGGRAGQPGNTAAAGRVREVHRRSDRCRSVSMKFARTERRVSRAVSVSVSQRNSEPRAGVLETRAEGARTSGIVSAATNFTRPHGRCGTWQPSPE